MNDMTGMAPAAAAAPSGPPAGAPAGGGRNPLTDHLMKRISALSPQEKQALSTGISPEAAQVIKKVLPEIAQLVDQVFGGGGAPGGQSMQPSRPAAPGGGGTLLRTV